MSSYIRSIATDISNATILSFAAIQRFLGGGEITRLENAEITLRSRIRRLEADNKALVTNNRDLHKALDARNVRAGTDALIAGRTRFGDIVSDTALTYDEVYLPSHRTTIRVTESHFELRADDGDDQVYDVTGFEPRADGSFRGLLFAPEETTVITGASISRTGAVGAANAMQDHYRY